MSNENKSESDLEPSCSTVAEWLRKHLEEDDISQIEAARKLGTSQPNISRLLSGDRNFTLRTLMRFTECKVKDNRIVFYWKGLEHSGGCH